MQPFLKWLVFGITMKIFQITKRKKMKNLLIICATLFCIFSCDGIDNLDRIEGMGPIVEQTLEVNEFTGIELDAPITIHLEQGETNEVVAKGHQNIIDRLKTPVINDKLDIKLDNGNYRDFELELFVTVKDLDHISIDGAGKFIVGELELEELRCHIDGAGKLDFNSKVNLKKTLRIDIDGAADTYMQEVDAKKIIVHMDGKGDLTLRGETEIFDVSIDGVGDVEAFALNSQEVNVKVDGLGKTEVRAENVLDVDIDGIGNVYYKGDPTIYKEIDGIGRLFDAN